MKRFKKIAGTLGVILLSVAFAASVTYLITPEDERIGIAEMIGASEDDSQEQQIDWNTLPPEVIAWVKVPGTSIDEPIVQATPDAPNAYLYKDALRQGAYGTPYIDCECALDSPFVMIYGHHMSDGSVFADFAKFNDQEYARDHQTIYIYTRSDNERHAFKVKAVDAVNASREFLRTDFKDDEDIVAYLNDCLVRSDLVLDSHSIIDETIWAFVTCSYQTSNSRTVVYAKEAV